MQLETLEDLYIHELKDLYSAEKQLIRALPKMAKAAKNQQLTAGFQEHLEQTKEHAARIEKILREHKQSTRGSKCRGMEGLIAEGAEMIEEEADPEVKDAGLISAAQRVEHYEIAGYGTARTYAEMLGDKEGATLLQRTLEEERQTDQKLSKLATSRNKRGCIQVSFLPVRPSNSACSERRAMFYRDVNVPSFEQTEAFVAMDLST